MSIRACLCKIKQRFQLFLIDVPPRVTKCSQPPSEIFFICSYLLKEVVLHRVGGGGLASYNKKLKSAYILTKTCTDRHKKSRL